MPNNDFNDPRNLGFSDEEVAHAEEVGIDLGLLYENLKLTPAERAAQHDAAVSQIMEVREALEHGS